MPATQRAARAVTARAPGRGFSMVEVVICIVLISMALVAGLDAVGASARGQTLLAEQAKAAVLARQFLSEIRQMRYADPLVASPLFGPEPGETRATFNDVDDFDGWQESPPQSADGTPIAGYAGWRRRVSIDWVTAASPNSPSQSDQGLKRITVRVTTPTGREVKLTTLRSKYDGYEHIPNSQVTYTNWIGITLQMSPDSSNVSAQGVNTVNLVP